MSDATQEIDLRRKRRLPSVVLGSLALVVAVAFGAALFVLPVRAWMNQRASLKASKADLEVLDRANADLQADIDRLQTKAGAAQAAREDLGVVRKKERAYRVLELPKLTDTFPDGWLYPTIKSLITERVAVLGAAPSSAESGDALSSVDPLANADPSGAATPTP